MAHKNLITVNKLNPTLGRWGGDGGGGGNFTSSPCWYSLNNSETVKAVTLAFCSIQQHFIKGVRAKFGIPNSLRSLDTGQESDGGISDFWISGQSLIKGNCHNSRISHDIDMNLWTVTKLDKRNKTASKKIDDHLILENCYFIAIFQFTTNLEQSGSRIPDA